MEEEIKLVNKIIAMAIIHGADCGGSYDQNEDRLNKSIHDWLVKKGWDDKYTTAKVDYELKDGGDLQGIWCPIQIVRKEN